MKKKKCFKISVCMVLLISIFVTGVGIVEADTKDNISENVLNSSFCSAISGNETVSRVGRHYTVKEEIVADRRTNEYVYPNGKNSATAEVRAFCYSEKHYVMYRKRVGYPDYKVKLYDEYHTTWHGEWKVGGEWIKNPAFPKKSEVTRERSALVELFGNLI